MPSTPFRGVRSSVAEGGQNVGASHEAGAPAVLLQEAHARGQHARPPALVGACEGGDALRQGQLGEGEVGGDEAAPFVGHGRRPVETFKEISGRDHTAPCLATSA